MIDKIGVSVVRTIVPLIVGLLVTAGLKVGLHLGNDQTTVDVVTTLVTAVYYGLVRVAETRFSPAWGWLLGLANAPKYIGTPTSGSGAVTTASPSDKPVYSPAQFPAATPKAAQSDPNVNQPPSTLQ